MGDKQPIATPATGFFKGILQFMKEHWIFLFLILLAFILGFVGGRLSGG